MGCNSKQNILEKLRVEDIIDDVNRINDMYLFQTHNDIYTSSIQNVYNIKTDKKLFSVKEVNTEVNGKNVKHFEAIPNDKLFDAINKIIVKEDNNIIINENKSNMDYSEHSGSQDNSKIELQFETTVLYKKDLLRRANNKIARIKAAKKLYSSEPKKLKELIQEENKITKLIEGTEEVPGLEEQIVVLQKSDNFDKFMFYAENEFIRLRELVKSKNPEYIEEAKKIINFYKKIGTFNPNEDHLLFKRDDIFDKNGKNILSKKTIDGFLELRNRAENYEGEIQRMEKISVEKKINSLAQIQNTYNEDLKYDDVTYQEDGLKDTSMIDMLQMNITNGTFSHNGILPQVMMVIIQDGFEDRLVYARKIDEELNKLQPLVEKELLKQKNSFNVLGNKKISYNIFRAITKNGLYKDGVIQRYSPTFTENQNRMFNTFYNKINEARGIENPVTRRQELAKAYKFRDRWYLENKIIIDIRKIPEITNNELFFSDKSYFIENDTTRHAERLKELLGEQGYKEEVDKQVKLLEDYQAMLEVKREELADNPYQLEKWIQQNNPFITAKSRYTSKPVVFEGLTLNLSMQYTHSVPRNTEVERVQKPNGIGYRATGNQTGYYDERFKIIENNPILKEFHDLTVDVIDTIHDTMPPDIRKKFSAHSIPALRKQLIEVLFDNDTVNLKGLKKGKATKEMYNRVADAFGMTPENNLSYANIDPITGKPDYQVNASFLKSNREKIKERYFIQLNRVKMALNIPLTEWIDEKNTIDVTKSEKIIDILSENLDIFSSVENVQKVLKNENLKELEIARVLKEIVTHQVVAENSFDLPKLLRLYSVLAMEYAARNDVLAEIKLLKEHYEQIKKPKTNSIGASIINALTSKTRADGLRGNGIIQINNWFERVILGDYASKNEFGDLRIKNKRKVGVTGVKPVDNVLKKLKLQPNVTGKIYTEQEKVMLKQMNELIEHLEKDIAESKEKIAKEDCK